MPGSEWAVEVTGLVKRYPRAKSNAVDGLSFTVRPGEVFGLLGPNGAGKSTTVGVLTTRVLPSAGTARVSGLDVLRDAVAVRSRLGVVPQRVNLDRSLTVRNNLVFHAAYHGLGRAARSARADELLGLLGLSDRAGQSVDKLSGGQAQRLMIARGLMHWPSVLFMDEPSTGLDPQARRFVHDRVRALGAEGVTVVVTTHDMDEAAKLSDRVGVVDRGRMLALDSPVGLIRSLSGTATLEAVVRLGETSAEALVGELGERRGVERVEVLDAAASPLVAPATPVPRSPHAPVLTLPAEAGGRVTTRLRMHTSDEPAALLGPVVSLLAARGASVVDLSLGAPTLEDVFIHLTGRELR
jgi:ABC-2 type transport system ATP-binding protein